MACAKTFEKEKASYLHVVDLNGAKEGSRVNASLICEIVKTCQLPIEVGGGIRTMEAIDFYIENGVSRVHILDGRIAHCLLLEIFTNRGIGTAILGDAEEKFYHE